LTVGARRYGDLLEFCKHCIFVHGHVRSRSRCPLQVGGHLFELDLLTGNRVLGARGIIAQPVAKLHKLVFGQLDKNATVHPRALPYCQHSEHGSSRLTVNCA